MRCVTRFIAAIAAVVLASYNTAAWAATYVIDPALSDFTVTGDITGAIPIVAQSAGSNVAIFDGSIDADTDGATELTINRASADARLQAAVQSPLPGGGEGTAPADVGLDIGPGLGTVAIRNFVFSISGGPIVLAGGAFDLTALTFEVTSGTMDYNVPGFGLVGSTDLTGAIASPSGGEGNLFGDTLAIPVHVTITFEVAPKAIANVLLDGQIVARVPEPGPLVMLGLGLVGLIAVGRRRLRKI